MTVARGDAVRGPWFASFTMCALAFAGCADDPRDSERAQPITGGSIDTGDPAVVAIAHRPIACGDPPVAFCSGVLVAPRVVLTAAHCLNGVEPRGSLEVLLGDTAATATTTIVVQSAETYAGYDAMTGDGDLAVLLLAEAAPVAPIARPTATIADAAAGSALRVVGFGVTSFTANDPGTKRDGTMMLGAVRAGSFDATPSPALSCSADSGGPVFATIASTEQLVGLTSRGDAGCAANAISARVDVALAPLVDPFVSAAATAAPGWPSSAQAVGSTSDCTADTDCPGLMRCLDQPAGRRCGFAWLGVGDLGATCAADGDCGAMARCARVWPSGADACHCFASSIAPPGPDAGPSTDEPPDGCGCAARDGRTTASMMLLVLALAFTRRRRRR